VPHLYAEWTVTQQFILPIAIDIRELNGIVETGQIPLPSIVPKRKLKTVLARASCRLSKQQVSACETKASSETYKPPNQGRFL
jgi:hypothetical protein